MTRRRTAIVVTGGAPPGGQPVLPPADIVIAADSGLDHALALGLAVDLVVGDLDSVSPAGLKAAVAAGTRVERHPEAKDHTDLELALRAALGHAAERVVVLGGDGGRLDHFLANVLLMGSTALAGTDVEAWMGPARVLVVRHATVVDGRPGELVSLMAIGGPVLGATTEGLLYPLTGEDLAPGSTRGVSNEMVGERASVSIGGGTLLVVLPGELGLHRTVGAATAGDHA